MKIIQLCCLCLLPLQLMSAYEQAFAKTPVGLREIKTLPAAKLIASESDRGYFERNNALFRPLFRYIQSNDIAMTTPVEAEINPGVMYFHIGAEAGERALSATNGVRVVELPERTVASIGLRGSYSQANFEAAEARLFTWIAAQGTHEATGAARGIYWNGPFTLGFLKRSEVHIPVRPLAKN